MTGRKGRKEERTGMNRRKRNDDFFVCPHCGAEGLDNFCYVEDIMNTRDLISLKNGTLLIQSHYKVVDDGHNPRLGCRCCDKDSAIPPALDRDWE